VTPAALPGGQHSSHGNVPVATAEGGDHREDRRGAFLSRNLALMDVALRAGPASGESQGVRGERSFRDTPSVERRNPNRSTCGRLSTSSRLAWRTF